MAIFRVYPVGSKFLPITHHLIARQRQSLDGSAPGRARQSLGQEVRPPMKPIGSEGPFYEEKNDRFSTAQKKRCQASHPWNHPVHATLLPICTAPRYSNSGAHGYDSGLQRGDGQNAQCCKRGGPCRACAEPIFHGVSQSSNIYPPSTIKDPKGVIT